MPTSLSRVAHEKCELGLPIFLKNNIKSQPAWQEIVDFFIANDPALGKTLSLAFQMLCSEPRHELDDSESKLPLGKAHRLSISAAFSASSSSI